MCVYGTFTSLVNSATPSSCSGYCLFYAIDGVLRERGFEILAIPVAILTVIVYIIGNFIYKGPEHQKIRVVHCKNEFVMSIFILVAY